MAGWGSEGQSGGKPVDAPAANAGDSGEPPALGGNDAATAFDAIAGPASGQPQDGFRLRLEPYETASALTRLDALRGASGEVDDDLVRRWAEQEAAQSALPGAIGLDGNPLEPSDEVLARADEWLDFPGWPSDVAPRVRALAFTELDAALEALGPQGEAKLEELRNGDHYLRGVGGPVEYGSVRNGQMAEWCGVMSGWEVAAASAPEDVHDLRKIFKDRWPTDYRAQSSPDSYARGLRIGIAHALSGGSGDEADTRDLRLRRAVVDRARADAAKHDGAFGELPRSQG